MVSVYLYRIWNILPVFLSAMDRKVESAEMMNPAAGSSRNASTDSLDTDSKSSSLYSKHETVNIEIDLVIHWIQNLVALVL